MTTAVDEKPSENVVRPAPSEAVEIMAGLVSVDKIKVLSQIRKHFDQKYIEELAGNIKTVGLINPIILRPNGKPGQYILVAGECRLRAVKEAGLKNINARVLDLSEEQALELQAAENLQRKNLTTVEEARGFQILTTSGRYTIEELAQRVDKSLNYVYRAIKLLELPEAIIEKIETGALSQAHGNQLLRVPEGKQRDEVFEKWAQSYGNGAEEGGDYNTAKSLTEYIDNELGADLASARFPKDKEYGGAVACTGCPSNSGNQGVLFDGATKGRCLNLSCFAFKTKIHKTDFQEKVVMQHLGAKFVEWAKSSQVFPGMMRKDGWTVKAELEKGKSPKGDYGIYIAPDFTLWILTQPKKADQQGGEANPGEPRQDWQREQAITNAQVRAEKVAILAALKNKALTKEAEQSALEYVAEQMGREIVLDAWGTPGKPLKVDAKGLEKIAFLVSVSEYDGVSDKAIKWLKLDLKKVRAEAKKKAAAEYDAAQEAKKAEAAKAEQAAK